MSGNLMCHVAYACIVAFRRKYLVTIRFDNVIAAIIERKVYNWVETAKGCASQRTLMKYASYKALSSSIMKQSCIKSWVTASLVLRNVPRIINNNTWRHEMSSWALRERDTHARTHTDREWERERKRVKVMCVKKRRWNASLANGNECNTANIVCNWMP